MSEESILKSLFGKRTAAPHELSPVERPSLAPNGQGSADLSAQPTSPENLTSGLAELSSESLEREVGNLSAPMLEELLLSRMDIAVLRFSEIMGDHSVLTTEANGEKRETIKYTFAEKLKAAEFVRDWVQRRRKIVPKDEGDGGGFPIDELRKLVREETEATIERKRVLTAPPKKNGRPTREEAAQKRAIQQLADGAMARQMVEDADPDGDDSELQAALRGNV